MRTREFETEPGAGAEFCLAQGLVGIGPGDSPKTGRMLHAFATLPDGVFVWTRDTAGHYRLGRIAGPMSQTDSPEARTVGLTHVRPADWLGRSFSEEEVPAAVARTFARGGRNFQRTHDAEAERLTGELWEAAAR
jgi:hypothetical protein